MCKVKMHKKVKVGAYTFSILCVVFVKKLLQANGKYSLNYHNITLMVRAEKSR